MVGPQKQARGTGSPKNARRCAVYSTPCANFQCRSMTWRSTSKKDRERHVAGQSSGLKVNKNLSTQCGWTMFSERRYR